MTTAPTIRKPVPRKPPAKRLFSGMAGSPLAQVNEPTAEPAQEQTPEIAEEPAQATVDRLMETVDAAKTDEEVKRALHILSSPKSASAIRGRRWREEQKKKNLQFAQQEAERKSAERAQVDRIQQIEDTLRSRPDPLFVMKDAPEGEGLLVTGEVDAAKLEKIEAAVIRKAAGRVKPKGHGPEGKDSLKEFDDSFAPKFRNPREVRLLHQFIYETTKKSPMLVCQSCNDQIGTGEDPGESMMAGVLHFRDKHPDLYKILVGRLKGTACTEDHEGMVRRYGGGTLKVQCKRCKKILYKPPKAKPGPRSDKAVRTAA